MCRRRSWLLFVELIALASIVRLPALAYPYGLDDEWVYAAVATEMIHGGQPYIDAVERKPPLLFAVYAAVFRLFGANSFTALHATGHVWTMATMAVLFLAARCLWGVREGWSAALLYAIYVSWGHWKNLAFNGEILMNLPIAAALWLLVRRGRWRHVELAAAGGLVAIASLLKQPAGIAGVAFAIYVLLPSYRQRQGLTGLAALGHAASLAAGFALAIGVAAFDLARRGLLKDAIYWTIFDHDMPHGPGDSVFWWRSLMTVVFALACYPLIIGASAALARRHVVFRDREPELLLLKAFAIVSFIGAAFSGRFYPHYYIQLLPALVLIASPVVAAALADEGISWWERRSIVWRHLACAVIVFLALHVYGLLTWTPRSEAATYVREASSPDERIFVWGQAAYVYGMSGRRPATRYVTTFPLTGYVFGSPVSDDPTVDTTHRILPGSWEHFEQDVARHPPALIVLDAEGVRRYPVDRFPVLSGLLTGYDLVHKAADGEVWRRRELLDRSQN